MNRLLTIVAILVIAAQNAWAENPQVIISTELGDIVIEVMIDKAPVSGGDFLTYVEKGLYEGEGFYRVVRSADNDNGTPKDRKFYRVVKPRRTKEGRWDLLRRPNSRALRVAHVVAI